ncbi:cation-binding protein [Seongchinamella sediminis]|uniref:Cation-binding protein n=2 Tax=Seongchinamella sediminis TaxID=2283635 RepID=A0A3L7E242_9GAMM|nr:cation-binding protein [Seongchinamella sediminis]
MKALRAEHRHIATVMQLFTDQLQAIEAGEPVDAHVVYEVMDYMASWPDRYHHPREDLIYGRVAELDRKAAEEVDALQRDHDATAGRGQQLLRDIERWREGELKGSAIVKAGREYVGHMYDHMNVEEKVVFPHIESVLSLDDWRELAEDDELRAVSAPVFGPRVQREFRNLARRLRRGVRRRVERGVVQEWVGIEALIESLEVLSLAADTARETAGDHLRVALDDSREMFREAPLSAPLRCSLNNVKVGYRLLGDMLEISREVVDDLGRVNRERRERGALFDD